MTIAPTNPEAAPTLLALLDDLQMGADDGEEEHMPGRSPRLPAIISNCSELATDGELWAERKNFTPAHNAWRRRMVAFLKANREHFPPGLASTEASIFERAHMDLGRWLGYSAGKIETRGSPDPWWLASSELCFVFEDHSEALPTSELNVTKARQVQSHPAWILANGVAAHDVHPVIGPARMSPAYFSPPVGGRTRVA